MRRSHLLAALAAFVLCSGVLAVAQQPGARPAAPPARPGPAIALLDVPKIFKQHAGFKHLMNNMKADAERDQTHLKAEREAIMKLAEQVKEYNRGTPDYEAGMETVTKRQADLAVKLRMHQETYREREAGIFYRVYTEMLEVVGYYAQANRMFDVWVLVIFGVVGFVLRKAAIPQAPFVIGLVLAPIAEQSLRTGLMITGGSILPFVKRPISLTFLIISILFLVWPFVSQWRNRNSPQIR